MRKAGFSVVVAAVAAIGFSGAAWAADCGAQPVPPPIPNGSSSNAGDMNKTGKLVEAYATDFDKWQQCISNQLDKSVKEYDSTVKAWQAEVAAFKAGAGKK
jgi:hypothetical protein